MYLAGDLGGTKTVLGLFEEAGGQLVAVAEATYASHEFPTFDELLNQFVKAQSSTQVRAACFGVAGTVVDGRCATTNLPWVLEEDVLSKHVGGARVKLINDLEATAFGMLYLPGHELVSLNPNAAQDRPGNRAVIAAGTGLGEALLYWDGKQYHPIASEGGHGDFGPHTDLEIELLRYLRAEFGGHVSYERVLSGPAFSNIYDFLLSRGGSPASPAIAARLEEGDRNATISELGLGGEDPLCAATVDLFCAIYGAEAGNLALRGVAVGGVYVGGGIAPKLLPALQRGGFLASFIDKGRFTSFLEAIDVRVALNPKAALLGAAYYASRLGSAIVVS
ncbi:MAG: glucokinase [Isosphaeraceae bacterium]|nr:glucokinase [Isosphaeraceae bacterium]